MSASPDAAASLPSVEVPAPASTWTEAGPGAGGHGAGGGAAPLVGDDVDPHPHVREALHMSLIELFRLSFLPAGFYKESKIDCDRKKLFDTHVRVSGNLDKVKSIKSQIRLDI